MLGNKQLKDVVREKEAYINLLEELDRTGKLRQSEYKERVNFTIDETLITEFRRYCEENNMKMSTKVESMIREFLKKKK